MPLPYSYITDYLNMGAGGVLANFTEDTPDNGKKEPISGSTIKAGLFPVIDRCGTTHGHKLSVSGSFVGINPDCTKTEPYSFSLKLIVPDPNKVIAQAEFVTAFATAYAGTSVFI